MTNENIEDYYQVIEKEKALEMLYDNNTSWIYIGEKPSNEVFWNKKTGELIAHSYRKDLIYRLAKPIIK